MLEGGKKKMIFMFYSHCLQNLSNNDSNMDSRLKEMSRSGVSCGHYFPFFVLRCPRFTS